MKELFEKIYTREDGRFEIRYHYGYKDDGTSNYKSVYGSNEKEVLSAYNKLMNDLKCKNYLLIYYKTYIYKF